MNSGGHRGSHMHMHMHMRMCHVPKSHLVSEFDRFIYLFGLALETVIVECP